MLWLLIRSFFGEISLARNIFDQGNIHMGCCIWRILEWSSEKYHISGLNTELSPSKTTIRVDVSFLFRFIILFTLYFTVGNSFDKGFYDNALSWEACLKLCRQGKNHRSKTSNSFSTKNETSDSLIGKQSIKFRMVSHSKLKNFILKNFLD